MVLGDVRLSYVHCFEAAATPSGDMKYSCAIMIPKSDKALIKKINELIQGAVKKGLEKNTFTKANVKGLRLPLRDGDKEHEDGDRGPEYKGFLFMNASSKNQPGVVDDELNQIMDSNDFYSGVWAKVDVNMFPYNTAGNKGIGVGLNNLMKVKDDERLDGKQKAEDAFADFAKVAEDDGLM